MSTESVQVVLPAGAERALVVHADGELAKVSR